MRKRLIAGLLACTCLQPALAAPIAYDEATDGDFVVGLIGFALPILALDVGTNTIKGTTTGRSVGDPDFDSFAFSVPIGAVVVSATVTLVDLVGDVVGVSWFLRRGSDVKGSGALLGGLSPSSPGFASFPGLPLSTDVYTVEATTIGIASFPESAANYTFEFVLRAADVPEPATALALGAGPAALGLARRRRND